MRVAVLGSGSQGNAVVVESAGRRILLDAGFSGRELNRRLATLGLTLDGFDAVVLSHEHDDHVRGAEVLARRHRLPLYGSPGTLRGAVRTAQAQNACRAVRSGRAFEVAGFSVDPFALPHDAREPLGFLIEDGAGARIGLLADLGCKSHLAWSRLSDLDLLILETNHDLGLLRRGPYPWALKQRVASRHGHLSNHEAAEGLPELLSDRLRTILLYHLSRTNNAPELAARAVGEVLERRGSTAEVCVTDQFQPTSWIEVRR